MKMNVAVIFIIFPLTNIFVETYKNM